MTTTTPTHPDAAPEAAVPMAFSHAPADTHTSRTTADSDEPARSVHFSAPTERPQP